MNKAMTVPFVKLNENAKVPERATSGSAGYDLCACVDGAVVLPARERALIPTGIAAAIPVGYVGLVFGRSGLGIRHGVTMANGVGVIDSDYRGEFHVALVNHSDVSYNVKDGDRIAQLLIMPVASVTFTQVDSLDSTERGESGFGSTGR
jgi:dUTP pyrophosphatase